MSQEERKKFHKHLEWATKVVSTWPEWKQRLLGGSCIKPENKKN